VVRTVGALHDPKRVFQVTLRLLVLALVLERGREAVGDGSHAGMVGAQLPLLNPHRSFVVRLRLLVFPLCLEHIAQVEQSGRKIRVV